MPSNLGAQGLVDSRFEAISTEASLSREADFPTPKIRQSSSKVRHFASNFLTVAEAAGVLEKSISTVQRWCETGKLLAVPKVYGKKATYDISPQAVELMRQSLTLTKEARKATEKAKARVSHQEYIPGWLQALSRGTLNGKVYSPATIHDYDYYTKGFFGRYETVSVKTLEAELCRIPAANFAKREKVFKALLCLGKWLIRQDALEKSFLEEIKALTPKRHLPPKRQTVTVEELEKLEAACNDELDKVIVVFLANTGLRAGEFTALLWEDVDIDKRFVLVKLGKGNKSRRVGLNGKAVASLENYIAVRKPRSPKAHLFLNTVGKPMDRNGLLMRLRRIGKHAKVKVSPHALRRAFVTINANKGRPLQMLQMACGHSDITTTRSYCLTSEQEVIDAMKDW